MSVLIDGVAVLLALGALVAGSDRVVESAATLARSWGVSVLFVGVTLVAVGSSLPEITTSVYGAVYGTGDFVVGHILGSVTSQITLGLGVVSLLSPLSMDRGTVRAYGGWMVAAVGAMLLALGAGRISHAEGAVLAVVYLGFLLYRYELEDEDAIRVGDPDDVSAPGPWLVVGLTLVVAGGHLLVTASRSLSAALGVPSYTLGLVTGLGTTAPEIAIAAVAIHRSRDDIAVGTLLGSNITDPLFSLGVGAIVGGITVGHPLPARNATWYLLVVTILVVAVLYRQERIGRLGGAGCLLLYVPPLVLW